MFLEVNPYFLETNIIREIVSQLENDKVGVLPTDAVFSFVADINSHKAYKKLLDISGKPEKSDLTLLCQNIADISELSLPISNEHFRLMKSLIPGPYTFILKAVKKLPSVFHRSKKQIGFRVCDSLLIQEIVAQLGRPLVCASVVNKQDDIQPYFSSIEELAEQFQQSVDFIVDTGETNIYPTTIIDLIEQKPQLIREGLGMEKL